MKPAAMTRREFLLGTRGRAAAAPAERPCIPRLVPIGKWADFPIGSGTPFAGAGFRVESLEEGLRAPRDGEGFYAIKSDAYGRLAVDTGERWDGGTVFSIMAGGPVRPEKTEGRDDERTGQGRPQPQELR